MNYLLDTDVLINFFKHREPETSRIAELSGTATLAISTLTIAELRTGWTAGQAAFFLPRLYDLCDVVPVTREIAEQAGEWRAQYGKKGETLGTVDTVIAATAHAQGMSLMTNNTKHYPMSEITLFVPKTEAA